MDPSSFYTLLASPRPTGHDTVAELQALTSRYPWFSLAHQLLYETLLRNNRQNAGHYAALAGVHTVDRPHFYLRLQQPAVALPSPAEPDADDADDDIIDFIDDTPIAPPVEEAQSSPAAPDETDKTDEAGETGEAPALAVTPETEEAEETDATQTVPETTPTRPPEQETAEQEAVEQSPEPTAGAASPSLPSKPARPSFFVAGGEYFDAADFSDIDLTDDDPLSQFIKEQPRINPNTSPLYSIDWEDAPEKRRQPIDFVTETLAQIYTEQQLYTLAIETFEKLILQIPEKNAYFAAQIKELKKHNK
ncbi:MAG: hypothetical protein LBF90_01780 [Prevotellaceae bacterium]|jgi:hypothetical protein|nr:hypothetical protein [Prevotellaceae bacterium]